MKCTSRQVMTLGFGLALWCVPALASAAPIPARDTARVLPRAGLSAGILTPAAIGLGDGYELSTMLVPLFLLSPNLSLRVELGRIKRDIVITGEYGLSVPTGAMRTVARGYFFPTWATSSDKPGWVLAPSAGLWISGGNRGVWTARVDTTVGVPFGDQPQTPLETWAPFELWFAPATTGLRLHAGGTYDFAIFDWLRIRGGLNGYMIGAAPYPPKSPFFVSAEAALEVGFGKKVRLALGGVWYNYDARKTEVEKGDDGKWQRKFVRSNDFLPTFDLIFYSP